jgi:hypothetical protein
MGWVGLGPRIFDLPNVGLGTYFRQPNLPNNPLGQGNPSGRPYRAGTLSLIYNPIPGWVKMGWVGLGRRIFDLPDVGLGTYFRQPNQPNNPLGPGNPSGQPYRAGTLFLTNEN